MLQKNFKTFKNSDWKLRAYFGYIREKIDNYFAKSANAVHVVI